MKIISWNWCTTVCGLSFLLLFMLWDLFCWFSGFRASSKTKAPNSNLISVFCFPELNSHTRTLTHKQSSWIIIYKKMMNLQVHCYTLNLLSLFWSSESVQWISKSASVTSSTWRNFKIVSRTLKVTGNRVMYDRGAWILRVIMLSSHALWCLLSVKKQKHNFHIFSLMYNISKVFFFHWMYIISICKCYQPQRSALADNPYLNLNNSWYHKNLIQ